MRSDPVVTMFAWIDYTLYNVLTNMHLWQPPWPVCEQGHSALGQSDHRTPFPRVTCRINAISPKVSLNTRHYSTIQ